MRRIDWQAVRGDLLLGFTAWSVIEIFFYSRSYLRYSLRIDPRVTWGDTGFLKLLCTSESPLERITRRTRRNR